ncbi:O-acetyl-ADP-ribose deacetylase 1 [Triplophysa tibetana]|uniref:O-acetyl-ADP-ribose deacetylase 1 n=1 Tax=Triplophysa tibetana TaxID=1572043 RepID=A0A5A9NAI2_9TELE|nr:O-acetyl-ADP-ribose deacetylase 1 [Triplophysa tibetana]
MGDLFTCSVTDALAHCISEDCRMGKGIAVLFKRKFGGVEELLAQGLAVDSINWNG